MAVDKGAKFVDRKGRSHRAYLYRIWDSSLPKVMFIGFNPSVADAMSDDPTIRRVCGFAKLWGYGGVYMANIFSMVSTDPDALFRVPHTEEDAKEDLSYLRVVSAFVDAVVFAWGAHKLAADRVAEVIKIFPEAYCLDRNKDGSPKHPLYVKYDVVPNKYSM